MAADRKSAQPRTSKSVPVKDLKAKTVSSNKAGVVKGGGAPANPAWGKNHNQSVRWFDAPGR